MFDFTLVIGIAGMVMLLGAFALNLLMIITESSKSYILLNICGAGILVFHAIEVNSIPFMILEAVWAMFAIYKLIIIYRKK